MDWFCFGIMAEMKNSGHFCQNKTALRTMSITQSEEEKCVSIHYQLGDQQKENWQINEVQNRHWKRRGVSSENL